MRRAVVDCTARSDAFGRVGAPGAAMQDLTVAEQTEYDQRQQDGIIVATADAALAQQRATDLATICAAGGLPGGGTFAALCRMLGGKV